MTGEVAPMGQPDEHRAELRASHADRDKVVELLRVAAGDGRLTADELDERLEAALTARTLRELAVLTADLPASPEAVLSPTTPAPREVLRLVHRGGNARQVGRWVVPGRIEIEVTGGSVLLDFTQAVISSPTLEITVRMRGGHLRIITRPGIVVDAAEVVMIGGRVYVRTTPEPEPPAILQVRVVGEVRGGNIRAHPPRRTFWQWLLRKRPARPAGGPAIRA